MCFNKNAYTHSSYLYSSMGGAQVSAPILAVSREPSTWCIRTLLLFATYGILQQNRRSDRLYNYATYMALQLFWMQVQLCRSRAQLVPSEYRKAQHEEHDASLSPFHLRPSFQNHLADSKQPDKPAPRSALVTPLAPFCLCRNNVRKMASTGEQLRDGVDVSNVPQHSSDQSVSEEDLKQERDHFLRIANAFLHYKYVYLFTTESTT